MCGTIGLNMTIIQKFKLKEQATVAFSIDEICDVQNLSAKVKNEYYPNGCKIMFIYPVYVSWHNPITNIEIIDQDTISVSFYPDIVGNWDVILYSGGEYLQSTTIEVEG